MGRPRLTYANVTSTLALFVALGGGAYAVATVDSSDVQNNTLRSADVKTNALTGNDIKERSLNATQFARVKSAEDAGCDPTNSAYVQCVTVTLDLRRSSRVLIIAAASQRSESPAPVTAGCQLQVDGSEGPTSLDVLPGEDGIDNTSASATNGFAITGVTEEALPSGSHDFGLACNEGLGDARIDAPSISVLAISAG